MSYRPALLLSLLLCAAPAAAQQPPPEEPPVLVQPGAPGEPTRAISPEKATDLSKVRFTPADVAFMQGMIHHHAQAIEMVALMPERTRSQDIKMLGLRIDVSQKDEIDMMREWLTDRGQTVPEAQDAHGAHGGHAAMGHGAPMMPGMLTPEQMAKLTAARETEFDRLFLEYMIQHHAGALIMVRELLATPGAGQESEIFAFASDVDADQRIEIERMAIMLKELKQ